MKYLNTILIAVFLLASTSGCASQRFNGVVGKDKSYVVSELGAPQQTVRLNDGREVWAYPTSYQTVSDSHVDSSTSFGGAVVQGIGQGVTDTMIYSIFGDGPKRYVYFDKNGLVERWETRGR